MHRVRYLIGSLILLGAVLGAVQLVRLLRATDDRPGLALRVEFRDARGLRAGADVRYRGVTTGTVRAVTIAGDGDKATAELLLDPIGAAHACVNTAFWIVTPRFGGLTGGASGLDTLVRDAYVAFHTPAERGSPLVAGSLIAGRERPPSAAEPDLLEDVQHGDLLMSVLVPENHGLRPGSAVVFRGMQTGDVRSVELAADGSYVEVRLRIARQHRQTVTDKSTFWVARPHVTGALFSGFTVSDVSALLSPYVSYYGEAGKGVLVDDGYRVAAESIRPVLDVAAVPERALQGPARSVPSPVDAPVLVRVVYAAVEKDTFSADDPIQREGTGVLFLDRAGRAVVVTARSLVDGSYTETDTFGAAPDIADEQIKVLVAGGLVRRAGRVWVHPEGSDLAALVVENVPPDLQGTPPARLRFEAASEPATGPLALLRLDAAGLPVPAEAFDASAPPELAERLGAVLRSGDTMIGIYGRAQPHEDAPALVALGLLPADLRPQ
jgi:hypothetical protein